MQSVAVLGFLYPLLVNADGLLSTASRESLVSNDQLKDARKEIGVAIKDYLRGLVQNDRAMFNRILDVHHFHIRRLLRRIMNCFVCLWITFF